jgi:hypothetical protein
VGRLRVVLVAPLLLVSLLDGIGDSPDEPGPYVVFPASTFERSPGWTQITSSLHDRVFDGTVFPSTWAATVPLAPSDLERATREGIVSGSIPFDTLRSLPPGGILILVSSNPQLPGEEPNVAWRPTSRHSVVRLDPSRVDPAWGDHLGIGGVSFVSLRGMVRGRISEAGAWIDASVWFGTPMPSRDTLASANAELNRLVLIHC